VTEETLSLSVDYRADGEGAAASIDGRELRIAVARADDEVESAAEDFQ
jgi:hypothetical protein